MKLIFTLLLGVFTATISNAQTFPYPNSLWDVPSYIPHPKAFDRVEIFEDSGPEDAWYARAVILNIRGSYNAVETDLTSKGEVGIRYVTTPSSKLNDEDSADEACVVYLPDNVIAIPECVSILEEDEETIYLYEYFGG